MRYLKEKKTLKKEFFLELRGIELTQPTWIKFTQSVRQNWKMLLKKRVLIIEFSLVHEQARKGCNSISKFQEGSNYDGNKLT